MIKRKEVQEERQLPSDDVMQRVAAVVTAFRAETQIELPEGFDGDAKRDTVNGDLAWWCTRHEAVLAQHRLYVEHPVSTVVREWSAARDQGRDPAPVCRLTATVYPRRVFFVDAKAARDYEVYCEAGGRSGMAYDAWKRLRGRATEIEE